MRIRHFPLYLVYFFIYLMLHTGHRSSFYSAKLVLPLARRLPTFLVVFKIERCLNPGGVFLIFPLFFFFCLSKILPSFLLLCAIIRYVFFLPLFFFIPFCTCLFGQCFGFPHQYPVNVANCNLFTHQTHKCFYLFLDQLIGFPHTHAFYYHYYNQYHTFHS